MTNWQIFKVSKEQILLWNATSQDKIIPGKELLLIVPQEKLSFYANVDQMSFAEKDKLFSPKPAPEKVSQTQVTVSPTGKYMTYKVVSGDSLWVIAQKHKVSVAQIKQLNGLSSDKINIGQVLKIKAL